MSINLRDYIAANMNVPVERGGCIPQDMAVTIMDGLPPDWDCDRLKAYTWWATAEARFRYIRADAMMAERLR
jgi:hypothetical protein